MEARGEAASPARDEGRCGALLFAARRASWAAVWQPLRAFYGHKVQRQPRTLGSPGPTDVARKPVWRRSRAAVIPSGRRHLLASVLQSLAFRLRAAAAERANELGCLWVEHTRAPFWSCLDEHSALEQRSERQEQFQSQSDSLPPRRALVRCAAQAPRSPSSATLRFPARGACKPSRASGSCASSASEQALLEGSSIFAARSSSRSDTTSRDCAPTSQD